MTLWGASGTAARISNTTSRSSSSSSSGGGGGGGGDDAIDGFRLRKTTTLSLCEVWCGACRID